MPDWRLSPDAAADLREIGHYTQKRWGARQRRIYLADLVSAFDRVAANPGLGMVRGEFGRGIRSYVCGSHVIFYRSASPGIEIARVLHGRQDVRRAFGGEEP